MSTRVPPMTFRALLGVEGGSLRFERAALFFAAMYLSSFFVYQILSPSRQDMGDGEKWHFFQFGEPRSWLDGFAHDLILAVILVAVFRFIRSDAVAIAVSVVIAAPLLQGMAMLFYSDMPSMSAMKFIVISILSRAIYVLVVFGGILLALRFDPTWLSLAIAAAMIGIVRPILQAALRVIFRESTGAVVQWVLWAVLEVALMAALLIAGFYLAPGVSAPSDRIRKSLFVGGIAAAIFVPLCMTGGALLPVMAKAWRQEHIGGMLAFFGIAWLVMIVGIVLVAMLVHRMWAAIQDGHARTTPGIAVGHLFIPIYNFYWMFQVFPGWVDDYNAYARRHGIQHRVSRALFYAYTILCLVSIVPAIGLLASAAGIVVLIVMAGVACDAINAIGRSESYAMGPATQWAPAPA